MISITIKYPTNASKFLLSIDGRKDFDILVIEGCPSTSDACNLILKSWFKTKINELSNTTAIIFKINEEINHDELKQLNYCKSFQANILISFESTNGKRGHAIYWKIKIAKKFTKLKIKNEVSAAVYEFILDFLIESLQHGHSGLLLEESKNSKPNLTSLGDADNFNLLMLAAKFKNSQVLQYLLTLSFDVNDVNSFQQSAADISWENQHFEALLMLLNANSRFPNGFNIDTAPQYIRNFFKICENIHSAIKVGNVHEIVMIIKENPNLRYFFNNNNESAAFVALKSGKSRIYKVLIDKHVCISSQESINEAIMFSRKDFKVKLRDFHELKSTQIPEKHLMILIANSYICFDDENPENRLDLIREAFESLNKIPMARKILQIVAATKKVKVHFDFKRNSVQHLDPTEGKDSVGVLDFLHGTIFIAAKNYLKSDKTFATYASLIHELCHYAMEILFCNRARPYPKYNYVAEAEFHKIIQECKRLKEKEIIIFWAFDYHESVQATELIVRVIQMTVTYHENQEKLQELRKTFNSLYDYFENVILPKIDEALPVIEKLSQENSEISWKDLTKDMQMTIRHSDVDFQGHRIVFKEIIPESSGILKNLSSEQIKSILNRESISIGEKLQFGGNFYIERKFMLNNDNSQDFNEDYVINNDNRVILISDTQGAGKSTTFKHLAMKLKSKNPHKWISYIDLKQHLEVLQEMLQKTSFNIEKLNKFSVKFFNLNSFDVKIFLSLLASGMVIFLFDGVDEICPDYSEVIFMFFNAIQSLTQCQQYISTNSSVFDVKIDNISYKFAPLSENDKEKFLTQYLHTKCKNVDENLAKVKYLIKTIESHEKNISQNLQIMKIICDISTDPSHLDGDLNIYSIYDKFYKTNIDSLQNKGKVVEKDVTHMVRSPIDEIHQYYALKSYFSNSFPSVMENHHCGTLSLQIMNKKYDKHFEMASRIGILTLNQYKDIEFIHQTFAEFFIAQYLIENIFNIQDCPRDDELELRLNLLFHIACDKENHLDYIKHFILNYIDIHAESNSCEYIVTILREKFHKLFTKISSFDAMRFISKFFSCNPNTSDVLWWLDEDDNFFIWYFLNELKSKIKHKMFDDKFAVETMSNDHNSSKIQSSTSKVHSYYALKFFSDRHSLSKINSLTIETSSNHQNQSSNIKSVNKSTRRMSVDQIQSNHSKFKSKKNLKPKIIKLSSKFAPENATTQSDINMLSNEEDPMQSNEIANVNADEMKVIFLENDILKVIKELKSIAMTCFQCENDFRDNFRGKKYSRSLYDYFWKVKDFQKVIKEFMKEFKISFDEKSPQVI